MPARAVACVQSEMFFAYLLALALALIKKDIEMSGNKPRARILSEGETTNFF